jgi:polysaccharide export outer membrane protein
MSMRMNTTHGVRGVSDGLVLISLFLMPVVVYCCSGTQTADREAIQPPRSFPEESREHEEGDKTAGERRPATPSAGQTYGIEIGDEFDVKVYNHPELSESLVVRPDGRISLLLAEEIQAAGLTPPELDRVITQLYCKRILNPEIAIIMRKFAANRVYVGGEVSTPTEVSIDGRLTLLEAIYKAGGFRETAKLKSVVLLRDQGTPEPSVLLVNVEELLASGKGDIELRPYDAVFVSKTFIAKADKFVDQYVNKIVPRAFTAGFAWTYNLTPWIEVFNQ